MKVCVPFLGILEPHLSALLWIGMVVSLSIVIVMPQPLGIRALILATILRLIFSVGLEPTLFLLGAFNVSVTSHVLYTSLCVCVCVCVCVCALCSLCKLYTSSLSQPVPRVPVASPTGLPKVLLGSATALGGVRSASLNTRN